MGARPEGKTLERVKATGNYEPGNCVWATVRQQNRNRKSCIHVTFNGDDVLLADVARAVGKDLKTICRWYHKGVLPQKVEGIAA